MKIAKPFALGLSCVLATAGAAQAQGQPKQFVSVLMDFKLVRIADGAVLWERRYQRAVPTPSATNTGQASADVAKVVARDLFEP